MNDPATNEVPPPADAARRSAGFGIAIVVVMVVAAIALQMLFSSPAGPSAGESPEETIESWLEAQEDGDVETLELLSAGELQQEITRRRAQANENLARDLQQELGGLKGHVLTETESFGEDLVRFELKLIFADEEQVADVELIRTGGLWYLSRRQFADRKESTIPYGTPVAPSDTIRDQ